MILSSAKEILDIKQGVMISKRNLFDVIQFSKVPESPYYDGTDFVIGNTPQQGINWIMSGEKTRAVIIKTRPGSYEHDGWHDETMTTYNYSFKARKDVISYDEIANRVLLEQPQAGYPILLFSDRGRNWHFEGLFAVASIETKFVTLERWANIGDVPDADNWSLPEGRQTYVTHIRTERSTLAVSLVKSKNASRCEICEDDFNLRYGAPYIEAHHIIPIASKTVEYRVTAADFALLCPNCHKAVHIHMAKGSENYMHIKDMLKQRISSLRQVDVERSQAKREG
ncbi:HNH endonuclease [Ochrobactrum sp. GPK 3]|uniref:HNH endonuclease n=1 Tax=Brucella sp. 22210 TaxID=3453892 RepID=UPI0031385C0A